MSTTSLHGTTPPVEQPTKTEITMEMATALLAQRCREDRKFAAALRAKPRAVLQEMLQQQGLDSISLPENIVLWENTPKQWHLTVPDEEVARQVMSLRDQPLPDEILEEIQGGFVVGLTLAALLQVSLYVATVGIGVGISGSVGTVLSAAAVSAPTIIGGVAIGAVGAAVATAAVAGITGAAIGGLAATGNL